MRKRSLLGFVFVVAIMAFGVLVGGASGTVEPKPLAAMPDGTVYLQADGMWHEITPAQFKVGGLSEQAITYYGQDSLPGTVGEPATDVQVATETASYNAELEALGVTPAPREAPIAVVTPPATVRPVIAQLSAIPAAPVAGKSFVVNFRVTRSDDGGRLLVGSMSSNPSVGGKVIYPHWEKFQNGIASVRVTVPATAKGKTLTVPLTVKLGSELAHEVGTFNVG